MKRLFLVSLVAIFIQVISTSQGYSQAQQDVMPVMGAYKGQTVTITTTDTATLLETLYNASSGTTAVNFTTAKIKAILLSCETADVRFAFGATPTQAGLGHILHATQDLRLVSPSLIQRMKIISKTALTPAKIQVTLEY
jgi:hypothetical protein